MNERMYGIDRAANHVGGDAVLGETLGLSAATVRRWRRESPTTALQRAIAKMNGQRPLADALGVAQSTVSNWLRGDLPPGEKPAPSTGVEVAVAKAGSQPILAQRLGVSQQAVAKWVKRGWVPPARAQEIEMLYGVPRGDLLSPALRNAIGVGGEL